MILKKIALWIQINLAYLELKFLISMNNLLGMWMKMHLHVQIDRKALELCEQNLPQKR